MPSTCTAMKRYVKIILRIITAYQCFCMCTSLKLHCNKNGTGIIMFVIIFEKRKRTATLVEEGSRGAGANVLIMSQLIVFLSPAERKKKRPKKSLMTQN